MEEEDIIVTATDGLLDNLYDQEILLIATKSVADGKTPKVQFLQICIGLYAATLKKIITSA